jgi:rfaE bifunctional protein kinase chain/domain
MKNSKTVLVTGAFNIVHAGHLRLLNFARTFGESLVIGLNDDECPGVLLKFSDREATLKALDCVDSVVALKPGGVKELILKLKPDYVVKGKEHESAHNPELEPLASYGGHLVFSGGDATFSSRDLILRELSFPIQQRLRFDLDYLLRHNTGRAQLAAIIGEFVGKRVLVIGDLIIDEYIYCDAIGMSQEDPTVVVTPFERRRFLGGAGIVASHLSGLGASTNFISLVGDDRESEEAANFLDNYGVGHILVKDSSRPTTLKQRFKVSSKTMLRVSNLRSHDIDQELEIEILHQTRKFLDSSDGVIFSDFNYGCLKQSLVDSISNECRARNIPIFADSQASSQVGNVSRFRFCDFISATEREARMAINDFRSGLQFVAESLIRSSHASNLLLKLGPGGLIALTRDSGLVTDQLEALNRHPVDVAGAGDALIAAAALSRLSGSSIWEAAYIGSVAAGLQVSRAGNIPLNNMELVDELQFIR